MWELSSRAGPLVRSLALLFAVPGSKDLPIFKSRFVGGQAQVVTISMNALRDWMIATTWCNASTRLARTTALSVPMASKAVVAGRMLPSSK